MKIVCTCSGGEYNHKHIEALALQCRQHAPDVEFVAITDLKIFDKEITVLPRSDPSWHGWWVEMEMFHPRITGSILYLDIDTVIIGSMADIIAQTKLTVLRDAYRGKRDPWAIQDSCMLLPEEVRAPIWEDWNRRQGAWVGRRGAMQGMFQDHWGRNVQFWQDILPGQFASFKADKRTPDCRVVFFHGDPRPWRTREFAYLY